MKSVLLCLCLFPLAVIAQSQLQQVSSAGILIGNRASATADGGYITVTKNEAKVPFTLTAFKYAANGTLQWKTTVTNGVSNWTHDFPLVTQTTAGDYIITVLEELGIDLVKLNAAGKYVWDRTYRKGKGSLPSINGVADAKSNGKGAMFLCGQYGTFSKLQGYVCRVNETDGSLAWFKNVYSLVNGQGTGNDQDRFYALGITADGGCIAAGITTQVKSAVVFTQYFSLFKYSADGTREWAKAVAVNQPTDFSSTLITDFTATRPRNFLLTGYNNFGQNCYLSVNDSGTVAFAKRVANKGDIYYPLARAAYSPQTKRTYLLSSSNDGMQVNRVALNGSGDVQTAANTAFDSGTLKMNDDFITLKNGSLVAAGYQNKNGNNDNNNELYIAQYPADKLACREAPVAGLSSVPATVINYSLSVTEIVQDVSTFVKDSSGYSAVSEAFRFTTLCGGASPADMDKATLAVPGVAQGNSFVQLLQNPVHTAIPLRVSAQVATAVQITLTSLQGQMVKALSVQATAGTTNVTIPVADLPKGMYVLRATGRDVQQNLKVVIF